jgi:hypothetical protein
VALVEPWFAIAAAFSRVPPLRSLSQGICEIDNWRGTSVMATTPTRKALKAPSFRRALITVGVELAADSGNRRRTESASP